MTLIIALFAGFAAYGPPISSDAYEAFTARLLEDLHYAGDILREPEIRAADNFPSDVILQRCAPRDQRKVRLGNGDVAFYAGYECIMEVWPNALPSYRTVGFYRHNGVAWEYHGPIQAVAIPSPSKFDPIKGDGEIITKEGSLLYDGDPDHPFNETYDPYQNILDRMERAAGVTY